MSTIPRRMFGGGVGPCQLTVRTLADIETSVRRASPGTYAMSENRLAWVAGTFDIAGGKLKECVPLRRDSPERR
ncbi:hypothetical protein [Mycobacterium sp. SA01]|uniref:hypothetical protein n=1 Tax=Mycobacterium sp. SA01 TaxID=3238820 RepID=UPI00351B57D8